MGVPTAAAMCDRAGVAGHHRPPRRARARQDPRSDVSRWQNRRAVRPCDDRLGQATLAGPPQHDRPQAVSRSERGGERSPNRSGGHRLFGQAAPGLISAYRPPACRARDLGDVGRRRGRSGTPQDQVRCRAPVSRPRLMWTTWRVSLPVVTSVAAGSQRLRVEQRARTAPADTVPSKPIDARRADAAREHGRLEQALQIDRHVVSRARSSRIAQHANELHRPLQPLPAARLERRCGDRSTGTRSRTAGACALDQPVDPRVRKRSGAAPRRRESRGRCRQERRGGR